MIGEYAFCPKTGAPLSREKHYDETGQPQRAPIPDEHVEQTVVEAELTNGAVRSSVQALNNHFRRCHQRHHERDSDLYRNVALALKRLKRAATGIEGRDVYVWYALYEHLSRRGYAIEWMHAHVEPRCPVCHGPLTYGRRGVDGIVARCATNCTDDGADRMIDIRNTVTTLYRRTFSADDDAFSSSDLVVL